MPVPYEPGGVYMYRHGDPELWAEFKERAAEDGVSMQVALTKLVEAYTEGRVTIAATRTKTQHRTK